MAFGILIRRQGFECELLNHPYKNETRTTATCKIPGNYSWSCDICGKSGTVKGKIDPDNHEQNPEIATDLTNPARGANVCKIYPCCNTVAQSSHAVANGGTENCHTKCIICGYVSKTHNFTSSITKEPSCTATGEEKFSCECGYSYTKEIPVTDHTPGDPANCTTDQICTECGVVITPHTGHNPGEAPTCQTWVCTDCQTEQPPITNHKDDNDDNRCDNCGQQYCDNHIYVNIPGKDATCVDDGYSSYEACSICGHRLTEPDIIPAQHDWSDWEIWNEDEAKHYRYCRRDNCDSTEIGNCTLGNWEPDDNEERVHTRTCTVCNHMYVGNCLDPDLSGLECYDDAQHRWYCFDCGREIIEECDLKYYYLSGSPESNDATHKIICTHVGCPRNTVEKCSAFYECTEQDGQTFYWDCLGNNTHEWMCECLCIDPSTGEPKKWTGKCEYSTGECQQCGNDCPHPSTTVRESTTYGANHEIVCEQCGLALATEDCILAYEWSGTENGHTVYCTVCGWSRDEDCFFLERGTKPGTENCYFCPCTNCKSVCDVDGHNFSIDVVTCSEGHSKKCSVCGEAESCGTASLRDVCWGDGSTTYDVAVCDRCGLTESGTLPDDAYYL